MSSERDELVRLDEPELAAHLVDSGDVVPMRTCVRCGRTDRAPWFEQWGRIVPVWLCRFGCEPREGAGR